MGTFTREGGIIYNETAPGSGIFNFNFSFDGQATADDGDADMTWELGDTDLFQTGADYAGQIDVPLTAGGSVKAPIVAVAGPSGNALVVELPLGTFSADISPPASITSATLDTSAFTTCFAPGTAIATPDGTKPVETLQIGDLITTADGRAVPVLWLGEQSVHPYNANLVRIRAGALGNDMPKRDLVVTGDHGMILDGHVVNASVLVNGDTIDWTPLESVAAPVVYHVETEAHDIILAEGAPTETFVDVVTRSHFDNYADYVALYGADRIVPEMRLPRVASARLLPDSVLDSIDRAAVAVA